MYDMDDMDVAPLPPNLPDGIVLRTGNGHIPIRADGDARHPIGMPLHLGPLVSRLNIPYATKVRGGNEGRELQLHYHNQQAPVRFSSHWGILLPVDFHLTRD